MTRRDVFDRPDVFVLRVIGSPPENPAYLMRDSISCGSLGNAWTFRTRKAAEEFTKPESEFRGLRVEQVPRYRLNRARKA